MARVSFDYGEKVVLVTGGGSGIGRALVQAFAGAGAQVVIADIDLQAATAAADEVRAWGGLAEAYQVDVASEEGGAHLVSDIVERFGGLDVAANNAGIESSPVPLADLPSDNWRRVCDVNLSSVFYCMKAQIPAMVERGGGAIVNTASISGLIGGYNLSAYTATKHGVIGMSKAAALDYAKQGIRINALCPGLVDTPFIASLPQPFIDRLVFAIPMDRPGRPEEMAAAALWLCSDGASFVTGHALVVDGGTAVGGTGTRFDDLI